MKYIQPTFHCRCQPPYQVSNKCLNPRLNYNNFFEIQHGGRPPSWIVENLTSGHWVPLATDFPSRYQIWCKNVDRRRNYGPTSKSKMAAVRYLGFWKKPVFWALGPLGLPISHLRTKFGAKMLVLAIFTRRSIFSQSLFSLPAHFTILLHCYTRRLSHHVIVYRHADMCCVLKYSMQQSS